MNLFGTDGIRGVYGRWPLTGGFVFSIGKVCARAFPAREGPILLARDTRSSSSILGRAFARGANALGVSTVDCGVLPTSAICILLESRCAKGAAVVSASHNPARFNGIKIFSSQGSKLTKAQEHRIAQLLMRNGKPPQDAMKETSKSPSASILFDPASGEEYIRWLFHCLPRGVSLSGMRVVLDAAQGAASFVGAELFHRLGVRLTLLHAKPNGRNINENCGAMHPQRLRNAVVKRHAACGFALDGDADRCIPTDEKGSALDGDHLLALFAKRFLKKGDWVVVTPMSNLGLREYLEGQGFRMAEAPVGDRYVFQRMLQKKSMLGGEPSGHIILRQFLPTGDGLLTAIQTLAAMKASGKRLSQLCGLFKKFPQRLVNLRVRSMRPLEKCPRIMEAIHEARGLLEGGRLVVRYSGTESLLRVMAEARDSQRVERAIRLVISAARTEL